MNIEETNRQLCELLKESARSNSYRQDANGEPEKILGLRMPKKPLINIKQRHRLVFDEFQLEASPELKIREVHEEITKGTTHSIVLYFIQSDENTKRIVLKFTGAESYNLSKGSTAVILGSENIELEKQHDVKIVEDNKEVVLYEIPTDVFVKMLNTSDAQLHIKGNRYEYFVRLDHDEEHREKKWKRDAIVRKQNEAEKEAKKNGESFQRLSASEIEEQVLMEMANDYDAEMVTERRDGKEVDVTYYWHWVNENSLKGRYYRESRNTADHTLKLSNCDKYLLDRWRVAYDLFFGTNEWPTQMGKYMEILQRREAIDVWFSTRWNKIKGFFKGLLGKK